MGAGASADVARHGALVDDLDRLVRKQQHFVNVAFDQRNKGAVIHSTSRTEPLDIPAGSVTYMWKQDPSVKRIGIRKVYLPHDVKAGPQDEDLQVVLQLTTKSGKVESDTKANALAEPDASGDFLPDIEGDPFCFDLVHAYSVARVTLSMFQRDLKMAGAEWRWHWDRNLAPGQAKTPLRIIAHAGEKANATYHRGKRALKFYYLTVGGKTAYLCRSFDIVAHETGHAVLDALKPDLYSCLKGQPGALHESFADLTAAFAVLEQLDMCEDICAETKGDLRKATWLTAIGEQFAEHMKGVDGDTAAGGNDDANDDEHQEAAGMRNMNNDLTGETCGKGMYELSNVFSGFVFDVLVDIFQWERDPHRNEPDAKTLNRVSGVVRRMLLLALFNSSAVPNFTELARGMEAAVDTVTRSDPGDADMYRRIVAKRAADRKLGAAGEDRREPAVDLGDW